MRLSSEELADVIKQCRRIEHLTSEGAVRQRHLAILDLADQIQEFRSNEKALARQIYDWLSTLYKLTLVGGPISNETIAVMDRLIRAMRVELDKIDYADNPRPS